MKKLFCLITSLVLIACGASHKSSSDLQEDELYITRKYIGDFMGYDYKGSRSFGGPHIIWIKTTLDTTYGKISVYSKKCDFSVGDKLYLRRSYSASGVFGYWYYQIENNSSVHYKVSEFTDEDKVLQQSWF
jgi:hypothetical protein